MKPKTVKQLKPTPLTTKFHEIAVGNVYCVTLAKLILWLEINFLKIGV